MATPVTDILAEILILQGRRTIDGAEAVRRILAEVRKQVIAEIAASPEGAFTAWRQQQLLREIDRHLATGETALQAEIAQGITMAGEAGRTLLPAMAQAGSNITMTATGLSASLLDQIKQFAWGRVSAITNDAQARIRAELALGILGQKTPQEVAGAVAGTLERPGVFKGIAERAEVIVKTEMGRTFSMAHQASMESAVDTLPDLLKMWLHTGHPRSPRIYHLRLNGDVMAVDKPFLVGNIAMMYPRDPKAPAREIIGCGCMHVAYMKEWGTRQEFLKSWETAQRKANRPKAKVKG